MNIRRQPNGQYAVDSESSERSYVVTKTSCSCPHHTYRGAHCKHMAALEAHLEEQTALGRCADKAANLTDEELLRFSKERAGTTAGAACLLELAVRENNRETMVAAHAAGQPHLPPDSKTWCCRCNRIVKGSDVEWGADGDSYCGRCWRLAQAENQPDVDLVHHTCTCQEFTERRDGKRIGVLFVTCRHLQAARKAAQPTPREIPTGVLALLEGATEAERERALAVYR